MGALALLQWLAAEPDLCRFGYWTTAAISTSCVRALAGGTRPNSSGSSARYSMTRNQSRLSGCGACQWREPTDESQFRP
jgi:hypothetical protein